MHMPGPEQSTRCRVAIIGAGPAGLLLSHLLNLHGIDSVVFEKHSRDYIESRLRAGQLEPSTVDILTETGVGERLKTEGLRHDGTLFHYQGVSRRFDLKGRTGRSITMYGQREVVKDLVAARLAAGGRIIFEAGDLDIHDIDSTAPSITVSVSGHRQRFSCDFVVGADGFHGATRPRIAQHLRLTHMAYPFAWLGILAPVPPIADEVMYVSHERGFALLSMRSPTISRIYLQCPPDDDINAWPDERIWGELNARMDQTLFAPNTEILQKGITAMRSFVAEPMRHQRLFLVGDAAHIVPPSAAKGLNLAVSDVVVLFHALERFYVGKDEARLLSFSDDALKRVWEAQRFSRWMTSLLHASSDHHLDRRLQLAELDHLFGSEAAGLSFAENYLGPRLNLGLLATA